MAILLATRVAELISGTDILTLVDRTVFQPLEMKHSAQGLGRFKLEDMVPCQTDRAAPEAGGGDPSAKDWDWNSPVLAEARRSVGRHARVGTGCRQISGRVSERAGAVVKPETARLMVRNHNPPGPDSARSGA